MSLGVLSTARLIAEPLSRSHLELVHDLHSDPDFMRYLGGVRTREQTLEYLDRNVGHWHRYGFGIWILRASDTGEFVGRAGLRWLDLNGAQEIEIGWGLRPSFWGQGLATEIGAACLNVGRKELGSDSIVATTHPENLASLRVMGRLGMGLEKHLTISGIELDMYRIRSRGSPGLDRGKPSSDSLGMR